MNHIADVAQAHLAAGAHGAGAQRAADRSRHPALHPREGRRRRECSRASSTPSTSAPSASRSRAASRSSRCSSSSLERAGLHGVDEIVLGMAHRGRLNVLANVMGKAPADLFAEFEDIDPESMFGGGDVKYHLGFSTRPRDPHRRRDAPVAGVQPEPPRGGRPGRRRARARQAAPPQRPRARARCSASWCTATPRSPARAWWPRRST